MIIMNYRKQHTNEANRNYKQYHTDDDNETNLSQDLLSVGL